jgi:hypothetical protein
MKAMTAGTGPLLTQVCIVPRWTMTSPGEMYDLATVEFAVKLT